MSKFLLLSALLTCNAVAQIQCDNNELSGENTGGGGSVEESRALSGGVSYAVPDMTLNTGAVFGPGVQYVEVPVVVDESMAADGSATAEMAIPVVMNGSMLADGDDAARLDYSAAIPVAVNDNMGAGIDVGRTVEYTQGISFRGDGSAASAENEADMSVHAADNGAVIQIPLRHGGHHIALDHGAHHDRLAANVHSKSGWVHPTHQHHGC